MKNLYRIEIPSKFIDKKFMFWIGANGQLVDKMENALPVTEEESFQVMESLGCEAICYREGK